MSEARRYQHTQRGMLTLAAACAAVAIAAWLGWDDAEGRAVMAVVLALAVLLSALFATLTVRVTDDEVFLAFGPGVIRKRFEVAQVVDARVVRNRWYYGWGIRRIPGGWLYNVSGLDAVELVLADGRKARIGSDEPERLAAAIRSARAARLPR